jgi:large subunit ribosomal protein L21
MYAVIETGGKQYRVELGTELAVERLDATPGTSISFDRVLLVADGDNAQVGTPTVADALVTADVLRQDRGEKVIVFKYRPKARHRSKKGHRQEQTVIRVADIRFNGRSAADEAGAQKAEESKARKQAQAEADRKAAADQALAAKLAADAEAKATEAKATTDAKASDKPKPAATRTSSAARKAPATTTESADAAEKPAAKKPAAKKPAVKAADATEAATETETKKTTRSSSTRSSTKKGE